MSAPAETFRATLPPEPVTTSPARESGLWAMAMGDVVDLAAARCVKSSSRLVQHDGVSMYEKRVDLYRAVEVFDEKLGRMTRVRARVRVTVEARPFDHLT